MAKRTSTPRFVQLVVQLAHPLLRAGTASRSPARSPPAAPAPSPAPRPRGLLLHRFCSPARLLLHLAEGPEQQLANERFMARHMMIEEDQA